MRVAFLNAMLRPRAVGDSSFRANALED